MRKVLYMLIALGMIITLTEARWLNISYAQCNKYAGSGDKKGVTRVGSAGCFTGYERAKKICRKAGGKIPSVNDFKRLASQCGFRITQFGESKISAKAFQCLREKGFSTYSDDIMTYFWTRSKRPGISNYVITVGFPTGVYSAAPKYANYANIRCIK